jgi:hypothetical protein
MIKKILVVLAIFTILGLMWGWESTYTREATVTNSKDNIVTVKDNCGYIWKYKGSATVGDTVELVMFDNHTSKITDDIVKGVK